MKVNLRTKLTVIAGVWFAGCLVCITGFATQLPPEVLVDKFLLQAKMLSEEKNHKGALEAMERIVALQKEHDLTLPEAFPFRYAQTALAAGAAQAAIDSANRYLSVAGREGKHYREALELLVKAERKPRQPDANQAELGGRKPSTGQQPQTLPPAPPKSHKRAEARPVVDCGQWKKKNFWKEATVADVKTCLDAGVEVNARPGSRTALHRAARFSGDPAVIGALVKAGADLEAMAGWSTFGLSKGTPLHWAACCNNNPVILEALLNAGANLEARSSLESTPVNYAVFNKNPAVIQALLGAGAELDVRNTWQRTPLHNAAKFSRNVAVVEALLEAGADVTAWDEEGRTPLAMARKQNRKVLRAAWDRLPEKQKAAYRARTQRASSQSSGGGLGALIAGAAVGVAAASAGASVEEAASAAATVAGDVLQAEQAQQRSRQTAISPSALSGAGGIGGAVGSGPCEIPGYPRPADPQSLGLSWCPARVDFQVRVFALSAAGANCAIALGTSSTPEQIQARRRDIKGYCERLEALDQGLGGNGECLCPPGWGGTRSNVNRAGAKRRDADLEDGKGVESGNQEEEEERKRRQRLRIEENNRDVLNSDCTCISIDDQTGEYRCMDGFVSDGRSGKPTCDIRR